MKLEDLPQAAHAASEFGGDDDDLPRRPLTIGDAVVVIVIILLSGLAAVSLVSVAVNAVVGP